MEPSIVSSVNRVMSHVAKSRILEEIVIELRKKSLEIPANVLSDLKSARTLMQIQGVESKDRGETEPKIDQYLAMVEAYLVTEAEKRFDAEKVDKWLTALDLASCESCVTVVKEKEEMRMIPGIPRDQKWIRVEPIENLPVEKLEQLAADANLGFRRDNDGHLIVFGSDEAVKNFVKRISKPNGNSHI
jgi:hypothetical protein